MERVMERPRRAAGVREQRRSHVGRLVRSNFSAWVLLLPSILLFIIVMWRPILVGIVGSFCQMDGYTAVGFAGLDNYKAVLSDTTFLTALKNTFSYVFWSLVIGYLPPVIFAVMLNELVHWKSFFKFSIYFPTMVPAVAASLIWYFLFQPGEGGILNMFLGLFGLPSSQWLQNPNLTIPLIVFTMAWRGFGSSTIMYLASLQGVNGELYEAATVDGAGMFSKIRHVTLPQISGVMLLLFVKQIIGVFQVMVEPMTMTDGGPNNASISLNLQSYNYAFNYFQVDKSLALSVVTFLILIVLTVVYFKLNKRVSEN